MLAEGVRVADGFVFSCVRLPLSRSATERAREVAQGKAGARAIRQMLEWQVGERALVGVPAGPLRQALSEAAVACIGGSTDLAGMLTVHSDSTEDSVTVVRAVPEARVRSIGMDRAGLVRCLSEQSASGKGRAIDALLLAELDGPDGLGQEARLLSALSATIGPGLQMAMAGRWTDAKRAVCPGCMAGWTSLAAQSVAANGGCGDALSPLPPSAVAELGLEDLLQVVAVRVNDPSVQAALSARLVDAGFVRSAGALRFTAAKFVPFEDRPGKRLGNDVRAKVFASPLVVALLLADGDLDAAWGPATACLAPATAAFDEGTPESVARSISLLSDGMGSVPNVDSVSLLAAALLASDEPRLAEPLARAAFNAMPSHKFAGVNALRAQRALDLRDRARVLLPKVAGEAQLGNWGRRQLESVAQWLGVPVPPPAPPKGAAGEG